MYAIAVILWLGFFLASILCVFHFIGFSGLVRMFPEGYRGWHLPAQLASLAFFGAGCIWNPWSW